MPFRHAACLLPLALLMQACIALPVLPPDAVPFEEQLEDEVEVGNTRAADVMAKLGEPALRDGSRWVYRQGRDGWGWLFCGTTGMSGGCTVARGEQDYLLYAVFDDSQTLSQIEVLRGPELCSRHGLCFDGSLLMQASADLPGAPAAAGSTNPGNSGDTCTLHVYADGVDYEHGGRLEVDGQAVGDLVGNHGYYALPVAPGRHFVAVVKSADSEHEYPVAAVVDCAGSEDLYLRHEKAPLWTTKLNVVDTAVASDQLHDRWRARTRAAVAGTESFWLPGRNVIVVRGSDRNVRVFEKRSAESGTSWASGFDNELCGIRHALVDYDLSPAGGARRFRLQTGTEYVDFHPVCNADGRCEFDGLFDGPPDGPPNGRACRVWQDESITYPERAWLLVVEPAGDSYRELFFGDSRALRKQAECWRKTCTLPLDALRQR